MTTTILIGEERHPVKYGFNALRLFTDASGKDLEDLSKMGEKISLGDAITLVWAGLKDGARAEKKNFDLSVEDVADLLDEHPDVIKPCLEHFAASFVKQAAGK